MLGSADDEVIQEMLGYSKETEHEKIIRSLAVGMSFVFCGLEERADTMIHQLTSEKVNMSSCVVSNRILFSAWVQRTA